MASAIALVMQLRKPNFLSFPVKCAWPSSCHPEEALQELVANWHRLPPSVSIAILDLAGAADSRDADRTYEESNLR